MLNVPIIILVVVLFLAFYFLCYDDREKQYEAQFSKAKTNNLSSKEELPKYSFTLMSYASSGDDDVTRYLFDKKVTKLWYDIMKEYNLGKDVLLNHSPFCSPVIGSYSHKPSKYLGIVGRTLKDKPDGTYKYDTVKYKGDYSRDSIINFINGIIYQNNKK